jgi:hypothetical protein
MKSRLKVLFMAIGIMITASLCFGYVNNLKVWVNSEVLTHTDLNGNFTKVNTALDEVQGDIADTSTVLRGLFQKLDDTGDSIAARQQDDFYLDYVNATADSVAANDSIAIIPTYANPIGTKQAAYIRNVTGLSETVQLRWSFKLLNQYSTIDSIVFNVWTETTNADNYGIVTVYQDSTETLFKGTVKTTGDTLKSTTARTVKSIMLAPDYDPGTEEILLRLVITQSADSMFISRPRIYVSNR